MEYLAELEPFLLKMQSLLEIPIAQAENSRFFQIAGEFNAEFKLLLADYSKMTENKVQAKATLKYCQDILEYVSFFARFEEVLADPKHETIGNFRKMLANRRELIATKYRFLAERELIMFNDEDFRKRLSDSLERMMGF
ncbi:MAG: hypothetical protein RBG13Loki_2016 [Promethearchaeota archaeon CR_4]|nr:MAG: hypothetical protein RBG13Loki_2016 [Candidatus Lokiarchaeota archaeon CR_4]